MAERDNVSERRASRLAGIMSRRLEFGRKFLGAGERPPWTHKLNRTEQRDYFWTLPDEQKLQLWQQMVGEGAEGARKRATILGVTAESTTREEA